MIPAHQEKDLFPGGLIEQRGLLRAAAIVRHRAGRAWGR
jgi:hypothetical protein